jgi:hypothetical protein
VAGTCLFGSGAVDRQDFVRGQGAPVEGQLVDVAREVDIFTIYEFIGVVAP